MLEIKEKNSQKATQYYLLQGAILIILNIVVIIFPKVISSHILIWIGLNISYVIILYIYLMTPKNRYLERLSKLLFLSMLLLIFVNIAERVMHLLNGEILQTILLDYKEMAEIIYFLICFAHPIILPFPEALTIVTGNQILGTSKTFIFGVLGSFLGITTMFLMAKFGGERLIRKFINEKQLERYYRFVKKNETIIMILLFIIPILPDEIVCIGAGISKVNLKKFLIIAFLSKSIIFFTLVYAVELL